MKPVLDPAYFPYKADRPKSGNVAEKQLWTFSMRFWQQAENFGLGGQAGSWFISLFDRLTALSKIGLDEFLKDVETRGAFRFHQIDWAAKNIPVTRDHFDWLPVNYRENPEEFPFYQFHVSKALGRVVGFFDENRIFNVLVLDPNHNIQPSDYNDYKIRPTKIGSCQFSAIASVAHDHVSKCVAVECSVRSSIRAVLEQATLEQTGGIVICRISNDQHDRFKVLRDEGKAQDIGEILAMGFDVYEAC